MSGLLRRLDLRNITGESSIVFDPIANEPIPDELLRAGPNDPGPSRVPGEK